MFIHSECTEELFNQGYYKIDSTQLQNEMFKETNREPNEFLISIFVNYNYQNHFRYYDDLPYYLNPEKKCSTCLNIPFTLINHYNYSISKVLGPIFSSLLASHKLSPKL